MNKMIYKRLNDDAIMCINKYTNRAGCVYHRLFLYYEDTESIVELGTLLMKSKIHKWRECDQYDFNNNYVIVWAYNEEEQKLDLTNVYDVAKRKNVMVDEKWEDFFIYMNASDDIRNHKLKAKRLGTKISIK